MSRPSFRAGTVVLASLGLALITMNGCFTVLRHPKSPDPTATTPEVVYPHSSVVYGWYDDHYYGSYHDYYVGPVVYYPPHDPDSPPAADTEDAEPAPSPVLVSGFGRGGRGRDEPPRNRPVVTPQPADDRSNDQPSANVSNPPPRSEPETRPGAQPQGESGPPGMAMRIGSASLL